MSAHSLIDRIAGHPAVYDSIQRLLGRDAIARRMAPWLGDVSGRVLDVGGGTGQSRTSLGPQARYVCVDIEMRKLLPLKHKSRNANAVLADATALPLRSDTVDLALLIAVVHHLSTEAMRATVAEIARVLVPWGRLIVLDAVWAPRRLAGRALWASDRGSYPRTAGSIEAALSGSFAIDDAMTFAVIHEYCAFRCRKLTPAPESRP